MVCKCTVVSFPHSWLLRSYCIRNNNHLRKVRLHTTTQPRMHLVMRTFFHFVGLCSSFISFFPRGWWETETRRVKCSSDAYTASFAGTSINPAIIHTFSCGLQLYPCVAAIITPHNAAIIHAFSDGLQLYKPSVWRANRISAAPEPPRDDMSSIWIACAPYSLWFARWASIVHCTYTLLNLTILSVRHLGSCILVPLRHRSLSVGSQSQVSSMWPYYGRWCLWLNILLFFPL